VWTVFVNTVVNTVGKGAGGGGGDGLVGGDFWFLPGQCGDGPPQTSGVLAVGKAIELEPPPPTVVSGDGVSQLTVYGWDVWMGRV